MQDMKPFMALVLFYCDLCFFQYARKYNIAMQQVLVEQLFIVTHREPSSQTPRFTSKPNRCATPFGLVSCPKRVFLASQLYSSTSPKSVYCSNSIYCTPD